MLICFGVTGAGADLLADFLACCRMISNEGSGAVTRSFSILIVFFMGVTFMRTPGSSTVGVELGRENFGPAIAACRASLLRIASWRLCSINLSCSSDNSESG
jgi:hypothetical protein